MAWLIPSKDKKPRQLAKKGTHPAIIVGLIDLGVQENKMFGTTARKILVQFELPNDLITEGEYTGKPLILTKEYTLSLHEKAGLRTKLIEPIEGRKLNKGEERTYDIEKILGKAVALTVAHKAKDKAPDVMVDYIAGIGALMEGIKVPKQVHDSVLFSLDKPDETVFNKLPEWIRKKINLDGVEIKSGDY